MLVVNRKRLLVEGDLDAALLKKITFESGVDFQVEDAGSKDGLKSKVIDARDNAQDIRSNPHIFYLRDRDYDFDVTSDLSVPQEIVDTSRGVLGWHWCRHEIENYLLEPNVLHAYLSQGTQALSHSEVEEKLITAALFIREYQVARRTLGVSKRKTMLPAPYDLGTRPGELRKKEIA